MAVPPLINSATYWADSPPCRGHLNGPESYGPANTWDEAAVAEL